MGNADDDGRSYSPKDVGITIDFGGPFRLAAVAFAVVGCHDVYFVWLSSLLFGRMGGTPFSVMKEI